MWDSAEGLTVGRGWHWAPAFVHQRLTAASDPPLLPMHIWCRYLCLFELLARRSRHPTTIVGGAVQLPPMHLTASPPLRFFLHASRCLLRKSAVDGAAHIHASWHPFSLSLDFVARSWHHNCEKVRLMAPWYCMLSGALCQHVPGTGTVLEGASFILSLYQKKVSFLFSFSSLFKRNKLICTRSQRNAKWRHAHSVGFWHFLKEENWSTREASIVGSIFCLHRMHGSLWLFCTVLQLKDMSGSYLEIIAKTTWTRI